MARFCSQCGAQVKDSSKFCNGCGGKLRQRKAESPHGSRPEPPRPAPSASMPPPAPATPPPASVPPGYTTPPPTYTPPVEATAPPQYWESYDYPAQQPEPTPRYEPYQYQGEGYRPADASRPLPPLFLGDGEGSAPPGDRESARERAREIARNFSLWAAGIVLFPIPFADLVLLMPVQTAMVISIGKAYGVKDPPEKMLAHIAAACGASVFGQITTMFVSSFIPIIGKIVTAPFVYGWTYGLGEVAMRYFESQGEVNKDEMKQLFKQASKQATRAFRPTEVTQARQTFEHLREHLSEDDYRKLRDRFSDNPR